MARVKVSVVVVGVLVLLVVAGGVFLKYKASRDLDEELEKVVQQHQKSVVKEAREELNNGTNVTSSRGVEREVVREEVVGLSVPEEPVFEPVETMYYGYKIFEHSSIDPEHTVILVGSQLRIRLNEKSVYNKQVYDTIYTDSALKVAVGYCEASDCHNKDAVQLFFPDVDYITPLDWVSQVQGSSYEEGGFVFQKQTWLQEKNGLKVWRERVYGLPVKVVDPENLSYFYEYYTVNDPSLSAEPVLGYGS